MTIQMCAFIIEIEDKKSGVACIPGIRYSAPRFTDRASVTQLVECHLAKVVVEGSNPFARSIYFPLGA